jgi:hypothetical protein
MKLIFNFIIFFFLIFVFNCKKSTRVFFIEPIDGSVVSSPVKIKMGVTGMTVHSAGEVIEGTGHHHLLIDQGSLPENTTVPASETQIHFGKGQTETEINLAPGKHKLTLQFANGAHASYGPALSSTIEIEVK